VHSFKGILSIENIPVRPFSDLNKQSNRLIACVGTGNLVSAIDPPQVVIDKSEMDFRSTLLPP